MQNKKILIGIIGKAHSLHGELRVNSYCHPKEQLAKYSKLTDKDGNEFSIKKFRPHKNVLICRFDGINNRTQAEALNNTQLFIERSLLENLEEEEFYIEDLIGLNIKNNKSENIGHVIQVFNHGAGDILEIKFNDDTTELFSFTKEIFPVIDIKNNFLIINIKKV